jgi:hypothetical protein
MKTIKIVSCYLATKDGNQTITKSDQIRQHLLNPKSGEVLFEDSDGQEYRFHDLAGKTVAVGQKLCAVGKKKPTRAKVQRDWEDIDY